jgi:hypothetical protein
VKLPSRIGLALLAASCAPQVATPIAETTNAPIAATQKNGTPGHRARLGWISWQDNTSVIYCNRRLDDADGPIGVLGPCWQLALADHGAAHRLISWLNSEQPDRSRADATPLSCALELEDARLVPQLAPARAWLVGKTDRQAIDEWTPDVAKLGADRYLIEPSFSPDGKVIAFVHVALGVGEGERTVEIAHVVMRTTVGCP